MEHYSKGQYDDDLTVGMDDYNQDFDPGGVDLFDYIGDEDSPLARLKSIILSIDWEISDDILRQFNEELIDLKDTWAGNKINLIYVQALEKLSKYIYKEKADAHPSAIKLLLAFYSNLEKIVSDNSLSEKEKKSLLLDDIQRFDKLKKYIGRTQEKTESAPVAPEKKSIAVAEEKKSTPATPAPRKTTKPGGDGPSSSAVSDQIRKEDSLLNLKAIVYGIDWEITERDLINLSKEVTILEKEYNNSKVRTIFLQGIGSLGAYINLKRSDAHADAFKLLHSFFLGLEKVVKHELSPLQEKEILMPEVQKFNDFKTRIAETISPEAIAKSSTTDDDAAPDSFEEEIQPAFSNISEDVHGFREDEVLEAIRAKEESVLVEEISDDFDEDEIVGPGRGDGALTSEMETRLDGLFTEPGREEIGKLEASVALQGVDVESDADDESDEEPLPEKGGEFIPALADDMPVMTDELAPAVLSDKLEEFFSEPDESAMELVGRPLPGIDVETEADDESDEEPLPYEDGEFAPALANEDFEEDVASLQTKTGEPQIPAIDSRVDSFFDDADEFLDEENETVDVGLFAEAQDEEEFARVAGSKEAAADVDSRFEALFGTDEPTPEPAVAPLRGVEVETETDIEDDEEILSFEDGELTPALAEDTDDLVRFDGSDTEGIAEALPGPAFDEIAEYDLSDGEGVSIDEEISVTDEATGALSFADDVTREDDSFVDDFERPQQPPAGVDVEIDDDDSEEEPLPLEDGELAPALSADFGEDVSATDDFLETGEDSESRISEQFDSFFEQTEPDLIAKEEILSVEESDDAVTEVDVESATMRPFEEAGFEEVWDEDIEEIPAESIALSGEPETLGRTGAEKTEQEITADDEFFALREDENESVVASELWDAAGDHIDDRPASEEKSFFDEETSPELLLEREKFEERFTPALEEYSDFYPGEDDIEEIPDEHVVSLDDSQDIHDLTIEDDGLVAQLLTSSDTGDFAPVSHPEDDEAYIVGYEKDDFSAVYADEVVFEAVDEDSVTDEFVEHQATEMAEKSDELVSDFDDSETMGTVLLREERKSKKTLFEKEEFEAAFAGSAGEIEEETIPGSRLWPLPNKDVIEKTVHAYIDRPESELPQDNLNDLRNCIASLGLEINSDILGSLGDEIERLRIVLMAKPTEKTFLQLLSTVTRHIEKYRYESDPEANSLLLSVFDKLETACLGDGDPSQIQEALFTETSKVLQWQQRLLERKPVSLTEKQEVIDKGYAVKDVGQPQAPPSLRAEGSAVTDSLSLDRNGGVAARGGDDDHLSQNVKLIVKGEIAHLQKTLLGEIQALRDELSRVKRGG